MYTHFDDPWHQSEPRLSQESYSRWATILHIRRFGIGSLVECGAGLGNFTHLITEETGARVTGIDISETAVRKARTRYPNLRFEVDTVGNLSRYRDHEAVLFCSPKSHGICWINSILLSRRFATISPESTSFTILFSIRLISGTDESTSQRWMNSLRACLSSSSPGWRARPGIWTRLRRAPSFAFRSGYCDDANHSSSASG